jgi:flagellar biogenesis protein FliO
MSLMDSPTRDDRVDEVVKAPYLREESVFSKNEYTPTSWMLTFIKTIFILCGVLLLIYLVLHKGIGKWIELQNSDKRIKILERVSLDGKQSICLIKVDSDEYLCVPNYILKLKENIKENSISDPYGSDSRNKIDLEKIDTHNQQLYVKKKDFNPFVSFLKPKKIKNELEQEMKNRGEDA